MTGTAATSGGRGRADAIATAQVQQVETRASAGHSAATRSVHAVLVHVQRVEQVREARIRLRTSGQGGVQVKGGLLQRRGPQLALILQLRAQQRIVAQVDTWRLLRFCFGGK